MADDAQGQPQADRKPPEANFATFIATLRLQVLVCLGEVPNPATQEPQRDLAQAKYLVDTLAVIERKTEGNLDENETRLLDTILYETRMRYVEACAAGGDITT